MVVAPVLATSLYALSRALERGETADIGVVLKTWLNWQNNHFNKWGNDYWCLVQFGALLALAGTGWVLTSAALITLLSPVPISSPADFVRYARIEREPAVMLHRYGPGLCPPDEFTLKTQNFSEEKVCVFVTY